jgi:uncharacterized protein YktA (UPF0223 family)
MKYYYILPLILCFVSQIFAQRKTDTIIYEKHAKPFRFYPKWIANGKIDTFRIITINTKTVNKDTTKNERDSSIFLHRVDNISKTHIRQTIWISRKKVEESLRSKDCQDIVFDKDWLMIEYQTPLSGRYDGIEILNCAELETAMVARYKQQIACKRTKEKDSRMLKWYDEQEKEMEKGSSIGKTLMVGTAPSFHILYSGLVPKKGKLRYQVKHTFEGTNTISEYQVVTVAKKANEHRVYEMQEDTTKAPPAMKRFMQSAGALQNMMDGDNYKKPIIEESELTVIEMDKYHYPVAIAFTRKSRLDHKGEDKRTYSDFRIQRMRQ